MYESVRRISSNPNPHLHDTDVQMSPANKEEKSTKNMGVTEYILLLMG